MKLAVITDEMLRQAPAQGACCPRIVIFPPQVFEVEIPDGLQDEAQALAIVKEIHRRGR